MSLNIIFTYVNSAGLDKMLHFATFRLGHHCLPRYLFTCIQNENGLMSNEFYLNKLVCNCQCFVHESLSTYNVYCIYLNVLQTYLIL